MCFIQKKRACFFHGKETAPSFVPVRCFLIPTPPPVNRRRLPPLTRGPKPRWTRKTVETAIFMRKPRKVDFWANRWKSGSVTPRTGAMDPHGGPKRASGSLFGRAHHEGGSGRYDPICGATHRKRVFSTLSRRLEWVFSSKTHW